MGLSLLLGNRVAAEQLAAQFQAQQAQQLQSAKFGGAFPAPKLPINMGAQGERSNDGRVF